jgi:hypothetical protein
MVEVYDRILGLRAELETEYSKASNRFNLLSASLSLAILFLGIVFSIFTKAPVIGIASFVASTCALIGITLLTRATVLRPMADEISTTWRDYEQLRLVLEQTEFTSGRSQVAALSAEWHQRLPGSETSNLEITNPFKGATSSGASQTIIVTTREPLKTSEPPQVVHKPA